MEAVARRLSSPELIGRREELARLEAAVTRMTDEDRPSVHLVGGEAGIGKTRLLEELGARARDAGVLVLSGRCLKFGGEILPLALLVDWLTEMGTQLRRSEMEWVIGPASTELARLTPVIEAGPGKYDSAPITGTTHLLELVRGVFARLRQRHPVVLIAEDLHWADQSTQQLFAFLGRSIEPVGAVIIGSYRSDDLHRLHPLVELFAELQRSISPERLDLSPLDEADVSELAAVLLDEPLDPDEVATLTHRTGGNAFFVEELLAEGQLQGRLPSTIREVVTARTGVLDATSILVGRVAALMAPPVDHRLLERVSELAAPDVAIAVDALVTNHFLVTAGDGYEFRHDLVREVFEEDTLPGRRARLHAAAAAALEEIAPDRLSQIARHWTAAGDQPRAVAASIAAGRAAMQAGAMSEARNELSRALELWPTVPGVAERVGCRHAELLLDAARACDWSRHFDDAVALGRQAIAELSPVDPPAAGVAWLELSGFMANAGEPEHGEARQRARELIPEHPMSPERVKLMERDAAFLMLDNDPGAIECAASAREAALELGLLELAARARVTLGTAMADSGDHGGIDEIRASMDEAREIGSHEVLTRGYVCLTHCLELHGEWEEVVKVGYEGIAVCADGGTEAVHGVTLTTNLLPVLQRLGRWDEVEVLVDGLIARHGAESISRWTPWLTHTWVPVMFARGEGERARALLESSLDRDLSGYPSCTIPTPLPTGPDSIASYPPLDRVDEVLDSLLTMDAREAARLIAVGAAGEADSAIRARYRDDLDAVVFAERRARHWLRRFEEAAPPPTTTVAADSAGFLAQAEAELGRLTGRNQASTWTGLADQWDRSPRCYEAAYARWRAAEAILTSDAGRRSDQRTEARDLLLEAGDTAAALAAKPLLAEVEDLARRARISLDAVSTEEAGPNTDPEPTPFGLTDRELEVLTLVTKGCTNGEIGAHLFISTKTASVHVSNILRKLEVANRIEAAMVARELELDRRGPAQSS